MARLLIREAHGGETRIIRDGALPYFLNQGYVVLDTLDDEDDASPLYLSKAEGDLRWARIADLGDPESAEVAVISEVVGAALGTAIPAWTPGTAYKQSKPITNSGLIYVANDAHTSGATFAGDKATHWTQVGTIVMVDGVPVNSLDIDSTPVTPASIGAVATSTATAKGDMLVATGASAISRLPVGTDGQLLAADAASNGGVKWTPAPSGTFSKAVDSDPYFAPQWPAYVGPGDPYANNNQAASSANGIRACRVLIPRTGQLRDICIWVQAQSGNVIAAVYDTGDTTAGVRTKKWDSGPVAVGAQGYQILGDPNLAVTQGQMLDLAIMADNATVSIGTLIGFSAGARGTLPSAFLPVPGGALPKLGWTNSAASFAMPATVSEGAASNSIQIPFIFARIS